jgi:sec-independent protein translocase protein TatC
MSDRSPGTDEEPLAEGSLLSHLLELRNRLLKSLIAVFVVFIPLAFYSNQLYTFLATPLMKKLPKGASIIATSLTAPFMEPIKLSLFASLFVAMPYLLYHVWAFVSPGLYRREKRFALPLITSSIVLFYIGVVFAYYVVFPVSFAFLTSTAPQGVLVMTDMSSYLSFVMVLFLAFGIAFEVPVATVLLVATGLVRIETMTQNRGYVLLIIFIIAAILTPPDAVSQCIMGIPMYLLYEIGIIFARMLLKDRATTQANEEHASNS